MENRHQEAEIRNLGINHDGNAKEMKKKYGEKGSVGVSEKGSANNLQTQEHYGSQKQTC